MCSELCASIIKGKISSCFSQICSTSWLLLCGAQWNICVRITYTTDLFTISARSRQRNTNIAISNHNSEHRYLNGLSYQKTVNFVYKINKFMYFMIKNFTHASLISQIEGSFPKIYCWYVPLLIYQSKCMTQLWLQKVASKIIMSTTCALTYVIN